MHKTTNHCLNQIAEWTRDVMRADHYAVTVEAALPERKDTGEYGDLVSIYGDLHLNVHQANSISAVKPYLKAVRSAGFKRLGKPEQDSNRNTVTWNYEAKEADGRVVLDVVLHFKTDESAACRYVTVGEKTVPDMKLMCGDELTEWDAAH